LGERSGWRIKIMFRRDDFLKGPRDRAVEAVKAGKTWA
jgi:hypothetical protein